VNDESTKKFFFYPINPEDADSSDPLKQKRLEDFFAELWELQNLSSIFKQTNGILLLLLFSKFKLNYYYPHCYLFYDYDF